MGVIRGLLDRIVLLCAVVAAGCVPSFIAQYRQHASGRLEQVLADLAPFQLIADREHGGSLTALIQHHLQSSDATFHGEGAALQNMVDAADHLHATLQGLDTDLYHQSLYLLLHGDAEFHNALEVFYRVLLAGGILAILYISLRLIIQRPHSSRSGTLVQRAMRAEAWRICRRGPLPYAFAIAGGAILSLLPISSLALR